MGFADTAYNYGSAGGNAAFNPFGSGPGNPLAALKGVFTGWGSVPGFLGEKVNGPPGTVGPADPSHVAYFTRTPDGMYVDPVTGQTYADAAGRVPVGNVNSAQQTGAYFGTQSNLLGGLADLAARQQGTFAGQNQLAGSLQGTIAGTNPSVALTQLGQGQDAIARQQLSAAAGSNGVNAVNSKLAAMGNIANTQALENQSQALLRAKEIEAAQNSLGSLYNSQLGAENTGMGTYANTAANYAATAAKEASDREKNQTDIDKANAQTQKDFWGNMGGGIMKLAAI